MNTQTKIPKNLKIELAKGYLKGGEISMALILLQGAKNIGIMAPDSIWKKVAAQALRKGELHYAKTAYEYIGQSLSRQQIISCARNALEQGYLSTTLSLYRENNLRVPVKKILKIAEDNFLNGSDRNFDYLDVCVQLNVEPSEKLLLQKLNFVKSKYYIYSYVLICKALKQDIDTKFLKKCYKYYLKRLDVGALEYVAGLLKKKISQAEYLGLADKAFRQQKWDEGKKCLEKVYA
jgi:hypothetical protein